MTVQQREFHAPGQITTWFRRLFTGPSTGAPPAMNLEDRRRTLRELTAERARWDNEWPLHQRRLEEAARHLEEVRELLKLAKTHLAEVAAEQLQASSAHDIRVRRLEGQLRAGASAHLAVFLRDVRDQAEALRARGVLDVREVAESRPDPVTGHRRHAFVSNAESVERRRAALAAAAAAAEALQLEALSEPELVARLTELRDAIPDVEPLVVEAMPLFTPGEIREAQWRLEEVRR